MLHQKRQIVLDTETTGINPLEGHRVIEIGCIEMIGRQITDRHYHVYLNPDREIEQGAIAVHGITNEFLADKPRFADIAQAFVDFISGAELIIHNAAFDVGFLDHELSLLAPKGLQFEPVESMCGVIDTLKLAREKHPGQRNSLDALCRRYAVDNTHRSLHGALLDSQILAQVYLNMTGGQMNLDFTLEDDQAAATLQSDDVHSKTGDGQKTLPIRVIKASSDELEAHESRLAQIEQVSGVRHWQ